MSNYKYKIRCIICENYFGSNNLFNTCCCDNCLKVKEKIKLLKKGEKYEFLKRYREKINKINNIELNNNIERGKK